MSMGIKDDAKLAKTGRFSRTLARMFAVAIVTAALFIPRAAFAQGQDKSSSVSKVERLNRAPVSKEILRVQLPRPVVVKLKNGLTLVLREDHKLPTVDFTMWIRPGQLADPRDLPGVASFTAGKHWRRSSPPKESSVHGPRYADSKSHKRADRERSGIDWRIAGRHVAFRRELYGRDGIGLN